MSRKCRMQQPPQLRRGSYPNGQLADYLGSEKDVQRTMHKANSGHKAIHQFGADGIHSCFQSAEVANGRKHFSCEEYKADKFAATCESVRVRSCR